MDGLNTGRMVHINDAAGKCQPAVVAHMLRDDGLINAGGWRETGTAATWMSVPFDEDQEKDLGWHWARHA